MSLAGMGAAAAEGASLAPLLGLLAAFWPAETAGPGMDPPPWQGPSLDYEEKLRELSEAAKQVQIEIEASRGGRRKAATDAPPAPHVEETEVDEKKKGYSCTAKCQSNGSPVGAYYVHG